MSAKANVIALPQLAQPKVLSRTLPSGRVVAVEETADGEALTVSAASGLLEVRILLTEEGPILQMAAAQIEMRAAGAVVMECESFHVRARDAILMSAAGDLHERVGGNRRTEVAGDVASIAQRQRLEARNGDLELDASEDVWIDSGRRVLVNS